jgi:hypothetical protein
MALRQVASHPHLGDLRVYDVRPRVHLRTFGRDFSWLPLDPYVPEGFRYKSIARFRLVAPGRFKRMPHEPLFQSKTINPTHGDIARRYAAYAPSNPDDVDAAMTAFAEASGMPVGETLLLQAQRITCKPDQEGLPSVEGWHRDGVDKIGVLCIERYNAVGGISQFKPADENAQTIENLFLHPGHMVVFEDEPVRHRVTPIRSETPHMNGLRDVLLMAYPSMSRS